MLSPIFPTVGVSVAGCCSSHQEYPGLLKEHQRKTPSHLSKPLRVSSQLTFGIASVTIVFPDETSDFLSVPEELDQQMDDGVKQRQSENVEYKEARQVLSHSYSSSKRTSSEFT
jgi:hypothetical protein